MSTTSGTPVNSSSLMNAVFGESASASVSDSRSAYSPEFCTGSGRRRSSR